MNLTIQNKFQAKGASPMKRNSLLKGVAVSVVLSAVLAGCGGTSADSVDSDTTVQTSISGKAVDGYLKDAVVCLDLNNDGYCQASSEPLTTTLEDGSFTLAISETHRANENFDEAMLLVFGGIDVDTGKDFKGKLYAPNDGSALLNVSPMTTLVAKKLERVLAGKTLTKEEIKEKIKTAREQVANALDIQEHEVSLDPVEFQKVKKDDKLIRKALQIQKSIEALMFAANIQDSEKKEKIEEIYEALAQGLEDMGQERGLDKLFDKAAKRDKFKNMFKDQNSEAMLAITDAVTQNLDTAFDNFDLSEDQLEKVAAITEDTFEKIRKGVEDNQSDYISGVIFLKEDDRFKNSFDWLRKYIEHDLRELGIEPTPELIKKLKDLYKDNGKAGLLLEKAKKLKDSKDIELQKIYKRVLKLKEISKLKKEAEEARYDHPVKVDLVSLLAGKTFYTVDRSKSCEVSTGDDFGTNCKTTFEVKKIEINEDVTVATDSEGDLRIKAKGNTLHIFTNSGKKVILVYKENDRKYLEFYQTRGEIVKLFKDANDAQEFLTKEEKEISDEMFPHEDELNDQVDLPASLIGGEIKG